MALQAKCEACRVLFVWGNPYGVAQSRLEVPLAFCACPDCGGALERAVRGQGGRGFAERAVGPLDVDRRYRDRSIAGPGPRSDSP